LFRRKPLNEILGQECTTAGSVPEKKKRKKCATYISQRTTDRENPYVSWEKHLHVPAFGSKS